MRSLRFLLSRRWLGFALVVALLATLAWWLGEWQFDRLADRRDRNESVRHNEETQAAPAGDVLAPGRPVAERDEWRRVTATGTYAVADTVIVRYRTRDGDSGVDVVVPLLTAEGPALLVDRGWLPGDNAGSAEIEPPAPPAGEVTVTGWVRRDDAGDATRVDDHSTRSISSERIGEALDLEVYGGFVDLATEDPEPEKPLTPAEPPDLGEGPHFFYGLQWWFFGVLAIFGFGYLAYDEWAVATGRRRPREQRHAAKRPQSARVIPPSTGSITPETKEDAGESRKAAARPNSSGRP